MPTKKSTGRNKFPLWQLMVLLICILTFLVSIFFLFDAIFRYHTEDHAYELISQRIQEVRETQETGEYPDLSSRKIFNEYISQVKALSLYDTGGSAAYGDKILTLSTCSYHTCNGRLLVQL